MITTYNNKHILFITKRKAFSFFFFFFWESHLHDTKRKDCCVKLKFPIVLPKKKKNEQKNSKNCFKFQNNTVNSHERSRWLINQEPHKTKEKLMMVQPNYQSIRRRRRIRRKGLRSRRGRWLATWGWQLETW